MSKPFVFTLMPFNQSSDNVYHLGIKAASESVGAYCERVDEQHFSERILDRIYNQISKADYIVADMSGRNPNVFYETGYAHALNKKVIHLVNDAEDIPFDLKHHPHIIYKGDILFLKRELEKRLDYFIKNPSSVKLPNIDALEFFIKGAKVEKDSQIPITPIFIGPSQKKALPVQIDIHNGSDSFFDSKFEVALQTADVLDLNLNQETTFDPIKIVNHAILHRGGKIEEILPNSWTSIKFYLANSKFQVEDKTPFEIILRVYTSIYVMNIPFFIKPTGRISVWLDRNE